MTFGWETLEPVVLVEGSRVIVYGIGDNRDGGDLAGGRQRASQGIQKQSPPSRWPWYVWSTAIRAFR